MKNRILSCIVICLLIIFCVLHQLALSDREETDTVYNYIFQEIPEIYQYSDYIVEQSKGEACLVVEVYENPQKLIDDKGNENIYFPVYVGERWEDHRVNWDWFYVEKNLQEVLWYDVVDGGYYTLDEWRESKYYRGL